LESFIEGEEYRVLVVNDKVVAIAQRIPAHVTGDGQHTIEQLVQMLNGDPRRGIGKTTAMNLVAMDDEANQLIAKAGYNSGDVMPEGEKLALRRASNLSRGGSSIDMTGQLHSDYEKAAILAARVVGLDVAGVDFITPDFTRSWKEVGGGICEINPSPGLRMHHTPGEGERRDVAIPILDSLFPENRLRRIPTAAITGSNGKTTTTRMTTHILRQSGMCVGLTCTDGVYVDDDIVRPGDLSGGTGVEQVMIDPRIDAAVLEIARGAILKWGTGIDQFDIAAVTNIVDEHLGEHGIDTKEDMAAVKGLLVELATKMVVLNADDPVVAGLASRARAKQLCYLSRAKENSLVEAHIATGQIAIRQEEFEGESWVVIYDKEARLPLVKTGDIPATINGIAEYNIENAMFAAAIAFGFGHSMDHIADALKSFQSDHAMNPGRLNTIEGFSCKLIIDFCHNSDGYRTVLPVLSSIDANRRYLACSMPGNRRDQDYAEAMKVVANHFDEFHLYPPADRYLRGKSPEESVKVLANGLRSADVPFENIFEHESQQQAISEMLSSDETGNLIFIAGLQHKEAWNQIQKLLHA
jgi:cyanophycin synthetase